MHKTGVKINGVPYEYDHGTEECAQRQLGAFFGTLAWLSSTTAIDDCCKASASGKGKTLTIQGKAGHADVDIKVKGLSDAELARAEAAFQMALSPWDGCCTSKKP